MDFHILKDAVSKQFDRMKTTNLFVTNVDKDALWQNYLASFPAGTNPMYRERTEHDCSCCKNFIRAIGGIVSLEKGVVTTLWDVALNDSAYQAVADSMSKMVKEAALDNVFLFPETKVGIDKNYELVDGSAKEWSHFFVNIPHRSNTGLNFYCEGKNIGPVMSQKRADHDVFLRSLTELTRDSAETILELIGQNSIYRGEEHRNSIEKFLEYKIKFDKLKDDRARDLFAWEYSATSSVVVRIRNTSIGTLLTELSEGMDLEKAVKRFEAMVAPHNYKRPTALVTPKMVENAKKTLDELGLTSALNRRYAHLADISVNDIIFADRSARAVMKDDVFSSIATKKSVPKNIDKIEEMPIEKFIAEVVPRAEAIEILFENQHMPNLVSLIAPDEPAANNLFKWDNGFSWSYTGDLADSIKERVKQAGGNVEGDVCCRLSWHNFDDLDLHMQEPGGSKIYYGARGPSPGGGYLDVDMNISPRTREPVENIYYSSKSRMKKGRYKLLVNQFNRRESIDVGFEVEIDILGQIYNFVYDKAVNGTITVAEFEYTAKGEFVMITSLSSKKSVKEIWDIKTQDFVKVNAMMLSPNYWGDRGVGNKHYFFMLDGCQNDGKARGFYNEFLKDELTPHRKVIEIVGSKMKTDNSVNQLSGLGFSSTQRNELLVRVKGSFTRTVKVLI